MISLISAIDLNRGIGHKNELLCKLPSDLSYFKRKTLNKVNIMGRTTFESIVNQLGHPLKNRTNIILTHNPDYTVDYEDCHVYNSVDDILLDYKRHSLPDDEIMIIGGASIYSQFLPYAQRIYLTIIDHTFEADSYFTEFSLDEWKVVSHDTVEPDEKNKYKHHFVTYERK